ncbi:MAG: PhoH family protein [Candidatus Thorarchaeota archaeon]|jgi:phosphate starvation-inducible PhoH-like protein
MAKRKEPAYTRHKRKRTSDKFHLDCINSAQQMAQMAFEKHDVTFLLGPAGVGKTHLAVAFAIWEILKPGSTKKKIIMTRPIVEAGESLGFLPGDLNEKVDPYMRPMEDVLRKMVQNEEQIGKIKSAMEVAPLAYMRGRTFDDSICIFDEAQNATKKQLKLFLTRFGENSKIIITGDPKQSDIKNDEGTVPLVDVMTRLETVTGIAIVKFKNDSIVRHPLVGQIIEKLED